jgi:glycosyltransferase involved in cell wall biosynthesis
MKVLLSTSAASATEIHGGPIVARRHAQALSRLGIEVRFAAPCAAAAAVEGLLVESYPARSWNRGHFADRRPDPEAVAAILGILDRFRPDVLYDVHGPAWPVEAAFERAIPAVSMIGDYSWFCRRHFLVDSRLQRCSGPQSADKCFECANRGKPLRRRVVESAVRQAGRVGLELGSPTLPGFAPFDLWHSVKESLAYAEAVRAKVDRFVVGDRHAEQFFEAYGVAPGRIARIAQCLPEDALVPRGGGAAGVPGRDRALRLGFVGRPHPDKGMHVLARALEALPAATPIELWIMHAQMATEEQVAPWFADAAAFRAHLASGRVRLLRPENQDALFRLMASVDVGVVPSIAFESPSLAMLEFVAQGVPVVRSESAGMDHVIQDGVNGRTFPYGDAAALRDRLLEVVARPGVLEEWRRNLPAIGSDARYARALMDLFTQLGTKSAVPTRETTHD